MKIGAVVLAIGIVVFCLGLVFGRMEGINESKMGSFSILLLILTGGLFWFIGVISLITDYGKNKVDRIEPKKNTFRKPIENQRLVNFVISFVVALFVGFIVLWFTDFIWGTEDPRFYQLVIPGYISGAFIIAIMNDIMNNHG